MALNIITTGKSKAVIGALALDASLEETHELSARVTSNPVESGASVTDHVSIEPKRLTIQGFITDSPVQLFSGIPELLDQSSGSLRTSTALNQLQLLFTERQPFSVVTGLQSYENMILQRLTIPRNRETGQALRFTAELIEVRFAEFKTKDLSKEKLSTKLGADKQAQAKQDVGKQPTQQPTESEKKKGSIAWAASKAFGLLG